MKTSSSKESQTIKSTSKPFFSKDGKDSFFSNGKENAPPFFMPSALQRKPNNSPNLFKGDEPEENMKSESNEIGLENPQNEYLTGHIPNIVTPSGSGFWKGIEEMSESAIDTEGKGNVVADINLNLIQTKKDGTISQKNDPVKSGVTIGSFSQPGGKPVSPFGSESFEPAFKNISYEFKSSKCIIKGDLDVKCPWGTNSGGRTDVPSATDAVVTKANFIDIKNDLAPSTTSPHKSPRTKYYSQALVERHEKFHGTDDFGWVNSSGLSIAKATLEAGNISSGTAGTEVPKLVEKSRKKLVSENFKWYKGGGTSHGSYAGEIRAYADGKAAYQKLADDVDKHGKTL